MSAIAGTLRWDGAPPDAGIFEAQIAALAHRGSGSLERQRRDDALLGGHDIARSADGHIICVADARIDNSAELATAMGGELVESCGAGSWAPLLLEAYRTWGRDCPRHLRGDFAFAVWDRREARLFCARDHLGLRPFYYAADGHAFRFASEIKGLLRDPGVPQTVDELRIADYLAAYFEAREHTFHAAIRRLPAGSSLTATARGVRVERYWQLDPRRQLTAASSDAHAQRFADILRRATADVLPSRGPLALLLSGGLDSSALLGAVRELGFAGPIHTFTATFPGRPAVDERAWVERLVADHEVERNFIPVDELGALHDIERISRALDEPFHAPNLFVHWALADHMQRAGMHHVMDGLDGDTTIAHGEERLLELCVTGKWHTLIREARAGARRTGRRTHELLLRFAILPLIDGVLTAIRPKLRAPLAIARPEFLRRIGWREHVRATAGPLLQPAWTLRQNHYRKLQSGLLPYFLEVMDHACAHFGLQAHHPYFDRRLLEFCLALPAEERMADGWDRVVQRRACAHWVPDQVRWRVSKSFWGLNFRDALCIGERARIEELIAHPESIEPFVAPRVLRRAWDRCQAGAARDRDLFAIWLGLTLATWLARKTDPLPVQERAATIP